MNHFPVIQCSLSWIKKVRQGGSADFYVMSWGTHWIKLVLLFFSSCPYKGDDAFSLEKFISSTLILTSLHKLYPAILINSSHNFFYFFCIFFLCVWPSIHGWPWNKWRVRGTNHHAVKNLCLTLQLAFRNCSNHICGFSQPQIM